ncbi:MAG: hypothetical protein ACOYJD_05585 [Christensenellales bacterium]
MGGDNKAERYSAILSVVAIGAAWGIFEATVGYALHSIAFPYSWMVWYPVACFFMANAYLKTRKVSSILFVGLLCAAVKLLNLLLPGRIDRVINPAVSIVFESLVMAAVIFAVKKLNDIKRKKPHVKALMALSMNTGWRLLYILYIMFLVPGWMREISVISSLEKFITFFITQNLATSLIIFLGYQFAGYIIKPIKRIDYGISKAVNAVPVRLMPVIKTIVVTVLLGAHIALELLL